jgi:hypothetical protein
MKTRNQQSEIENFIYMKEWMTAKNGTNDKSLVRTNGGTKNISSQQFVPVGTK